VTKHAGADLLYTTDHSSRRLSAAANSGAIDLMMLCAWQWKKVGTQALTLQDSRMLTLDPASGSGEFRRGNRR
jgi:hypothetical protein